MVGDVNPSPLGDGAHALSLSCIYIRRGLWALVGNAKRFPSDCGKRRSTFVRAHNLSSMDMWEPYITVVGKKAPQARVIFDRFHIVKHLNEAVDKTRRELVRELKGTARRNLKNTKFPLLKAKHNRSAKDKRCGGSAAGFCCSFLRVGRC